MTQRIGDLEDLDEFFEYLGDGVYESKALGIQFVVIDYNPHGIHTDGDIIWVPETEADKLTVDQLNAVLAHEQGHMIHGHCQEYQSFIGIMQRYHYSVPDPFMKLLIERMNHRHEYEADRYAASLGYADHLVDALYTLSPSGGISMGFYGGTTTHPTHKSRLEALAARKDNNNAI